MTAGPAKVVEHNTHDHRVVLVATGRELRRFVHAENAAAYARGWNQLERLNPFPIRAVVQTQEASA